MTPEEFAWTGDVVAPAEGGQGHVDYLQLCALMWEAWSSYLVPGLGLDREQVHGRAVRPIVKSITGRFDAEVAPGEALRYGARASSRSRRSFTIETVLWRASGGPPVASGATVLVAFDPAAGRSVEVPDDLWRAVEALEGRVVPVDGAALPTNGRG